MFLGPTACCKKDLALMNKFFELLQKERNFVSDGAWVTMLQFADLRQTQMLLGAAVAQPKTTFQL